VKSVTDFLQSLNIRNLYHQFTEHDRRLTRLEQQMATEKAVLARIDQFTTGLGDDVLAVTAEIKDLKAKIDSGDLTAVSAAFDRLSPSLDNLETVGNQLHGVAADPNNPVPVDPATP
jgi:hypothetical protein